MSDWKELTGFDSLPIPLWYINSMLCSSYKISDIVVYNSTCGLEKVIAKGVLDIVGMDETSVVLSSIAYGLGAPISPEIISTYICQPAAMISNSIDSPENTGTKIIESHNVKTYSYLLEYEYPNRHYTTSAWISFSYSENPECNHFDGLHVVATDQFGGWFPIRRYDFMILIKE